MLKEGLDVSWGWVWDYSEENTADSVKVLRDIIEKILELCEAANQEELVKNRFINYVF